MYLYYPRCYYISVTNNNEDIFANIPHYHPDFITLTNVQRPYTLKVHPDSNSILAISAYIS